VLTVVGEGKAQAVIESPEYAALLQSIKAEAAQVMKNALPRVLQMLLHLVKFGWELLISLLLAIIFSFILVMDWQKISARMRSLETSRIRTFYVGAAPHLQAFTDVLGKAFRAQALIAICNTVLTALGLWLFNVPSIALLSTIVFFCGFIPVFGLFISSVPILLFGLQAGGLYVAYKLIAWIALVHLVEAYLLNPKITGGVLHVHPLLILVLLLVGERFFGVWGLVVGVPVGYYVINLLTSPDDNLKDESEGDTL
jgi:predicted PurR-regulated permease PerM